MRSPHVVSPAAVAVLGPEHTQSHEALRALYPASRPVLCRDFSQAVDACLRGTDALLPIHNALGGAVRGVCDALRDRPRVHPARYELRPIVHVLAAAPGHAGGLASVRRVRTKDQARLQCRARLAELVPGVAYVDEPSTVAPLRDGLAPGDAVVVTPAAARAHGLTVLDPAVGPAGNASLFVLAQSRYAGEPAYGPGAEEYVAAALRARPDLAGACLFPSGAA